MSVRVRLDGWEHEAAEPDVGLGESHVHVCVEDPEQATVEVTARVREGDLVRITTTFTCPACGATESFDEQEPAEWFESDRPGGYDAD